MKKYIYVLMIFVGFACTPDNDYRSAKYHWVGIRSQDVPTVMSEGSIEGISIPVVFGGEISNSSAFTVNYTVTGGTYGEDYTIVGGSSANGQVSVATGAAGTDAVGTIQIVPVNDFETEENVGLTVTLGEASNGATVGFPLKNSFSLTLQDDDCPFDFIGQLEGVDGFMDGLSYDCPANVTIALVSGTDYTIDGLNSDFILNIWGEEVQTSVPVEATITAGGAITIPQQFIFTTLYNGDLYDYDIVGSGQVNRCSGNVEINYEMIQDGFEVGAWLHDNGYSEDPIFRAVLIPAE